MERAKSGNWKTLLPKYTITVASRETRNAALANKQDLLVGNTHISALPWTLAMLS